MFLLLSWKFYRCPLVLISFINYLCLSRRDQSWLLAVECPCRMTGCPRRYMNELHTGCIPVRASDSYAIMYQYKLILAWFYTVPPFLVFMDTIELLIDAQAGLRLFAWQRSYCYFLFPRGATVHSGPGPTQYRGFTITLRHTTLGRTPLDEWLAHRRDLYLKTHNRYKKQAYMPPAGFKPAIPASERPQIHALGRAAIEDRQVVPIHAIKV